MQRLPLFEWESRQKTPAMVRYEQNAYPRWLAAVETASHMYPMQAIEISRLAELVAKRHKIYDTLVDSRLDSKEPAKRIDPWPVRSDFRSLSNQLEKSRSNLVKKLQLVVFPVDEQ